MYILYVYIYIQVYMYIYIYKIYTNDLELGKKGTRIVTPETQRHEFVLEVAKTVVRASKATFPEYTHAYTNVEAYF